MAFAIDNKKITKNTLALYVRMGITMIISFFTARVTLQQLGIEDYGLNNLVGSIVSMFSFLNGSMGTAVQRFYSIEIGKGCEDNLKKIFGTGLYLHIIIAIVTVIAAEVFAIFFLHKMNIPQERLHAAQVVFQISIISLGLNIINVPYAALLRAREMFSQTAIIEIIQSLLRLVVLYFLVHINYDKLITFSLLNFCVTLFHLGAFTLIAYKFKETHTLPYPNKDLIKKMISFISMLVITVLCQLFKTQGIIILINLFFNLTINAAYAIAVQVSNMVNTFVMNFKQSMMPQLMASYGAGDLNAMHKIINTGTKITFLLLLMISVPLIFDGNVLLKIWLDTPPEYSAKLVTLVLIYINISSFTYFQYQGIHASGNIKKQQIWISSLYIFNILLIYIVLKLGADFESALYVNMFISFLQCVVNLIYAKKYYDYNVKYFVKSILVPCLALTIIVCVTLLAISGIFLSETVKFLVDFVIAETMIIILGYFLVLDKFEKNKIKHFLANFISKNDSK